MHLEMLQGMVGCFMQPLSPQGVPPSTQGAPPAMEEEDKVEEIEHEEL